MVFVFEDVIGAVVFVVFVDVIGVIFGVEVIVANGAVDFESVWDDWMEALEVEDNG